MNFKNLKIINKIQCADLNLTLLFGINGTFKLHMVVARSSLYAS